MAGTQVHLGRWQLPFILFRVADGACTVLLPLAALLRYDLGVAGTAAVVALLNLVTLPAVQAWCRLMDRFPARRRIAMAGLAAAGACLGILAAPIPLWAYLAAASGFVLFGVAAAPAAGILALEGRPRAEWAQATGRLSRRTGMAYIAGLLCTLLVSVWPQHLRWVFAGAGVLAVAAAWAAARTIEPRRVRWQGIPGAASAERPPPVPEPAIPIEAVRAQQRFERPFWFPSRIRFRPRLAWQGAPAALLVGVVALFVGTVSLTAGLPGILRHELGFGAASIVLVQLGAPVGTALAYSWAGQVGTRRGEGTAIRVGIIGRAFAVAVMVVSLAFAPGGVVLLLLASNLLLGLSFSLLQVNLPCLLASRHPKGVGAGVGTYHAAVGTGVLVGSLVAVAVATAYPLAALYAAALAATFVAALLLWQGLRPRSSPGPH